MTRDQYDEYEPDYDDDCWNCGGEGFVAHCFTEYACMYPDEGCDLCMMRCEFCNAVKPDAALQQVLADALRDSGGGPQGGDAKQAPGEAPQSGGEAASPNLPAKASPTPYPQGTQPHEG